MPTIGGAVGSAIRDQVSDEDLFLRRLQVRKLRSYSTIANVILLLAAPSAFWFQRDDRGEVMGFAFLATALISMLGKFLMRRLVNIERFINPITLAFSVLFLIPSAIATALRPEAECGRAIVLVGLAFSTYCCSLRWLVALQFAQAVTSVVAWNFSSRSYGANEFLIFFVTVPAVGYIIFQSQLSSLKRAYRLQRESTARQRELEQALQQLTAETERRLDEERLRRESESRLKEQHDQLLHVSRLTTMGELVAGIAHELHQPLHATSMYAGVLDALTASDDSVIFGRLHELTGKIVGLTQQSAATVRRLQNFVRRGPRMRVPADLRDIVRDALELTANEVRHMGVRIQVNAPEAGCVASVDPVQIQQVLVNLVRNSCEAMHATPAGQREINISIQTVDNDFEVLVADTGVGISALQASKIFNAFSSTKPDGLGIGLAISRTILGDHNGSIELISGSSIGATFRLLIPAQSEVAEVGR